jgi:hypothetical protein
MRSSLALLRPPLLAALLLGLTVGACLDAPPEPGPAVARLVAAWDPLACGDPHRIVVELEGDDGATLSASTPCNIGGVTLDVPHFGSYRGRIYAWALAAPIRSITPIDLMIDEPIVHWQVSTPR